jgi:HK97 family phage major capsid protein
VEENKTLDSTALVIAALDGMKKEMGQTVKIAEVTKAVNDATEPLKEELSSLKVKLDEADKTIKLIDEKAGALKANSGNKIITNFGTAFAEAVKENFDSIRKVNKATRHELELKTVGDMTAAANLTGSSVATYSPNQGILPAQKVNFRNLVPSIQSETGTWKLYRESGTEGSISLQSTPGVAKTQIDYDFTEATYTADFMAGFARISRQMLQDLPFLQSALPQMLLRDFYKAENAAFYQALSSVATGVTTTSGANAVEKIIDYIARLLDANFAPSAITVNSLLWGSILKTKPSDYSIPGGVTIDQAGNIRILGLPLIPASWMPANKVLVGEWDLAKRVEASGLSVQFFEQDGTNVTKNQITVRVECREVLAVERLDAFTFADVS